MSQRKKKRGVREKEREMVKEEKIIEGRGMLANRELIEGKARVCVCVCFL